MSWFQILRHRTPGRRINRKIPFPAVLRENALLGNPPYKAAFVGAPGQWGFARHGRGLRRVRGGSCAPNAMPPFRASLESASLPPPAELLALAGREAQDAEAAAFPAY